MRIWIAVLVLATLFAARQRIVVPQPSALGSARSILFIAAHPDDEVPIAPWLAKKCIEEGARCSFLVVTTGENGTCLLPGGCGQDLAAIRAAEMARSAARELYLIETRIDVTLEPLSIVFSAAGVGARVVERFDATSRWDALLRTMEIHRSQFDEQWIAEAAKSPLRAVFFASYP